MNWLYSQGPLLLSGAVKRETQTTNISTVTSAIPGVWKSFERWGIVLTENYLLEAFTISLFKVSEIIVRSILLFLTTKVFVMMAVITCTYYWTQIYKGTLKVTEDISVTLHLWMLCDLYTTDPRFQNTNVP